MAFFGKKKKADPMAFQGAVEDEILKRYQVGSIARQHQERTIYLIDTGMLSLNLAVGTNGMLGGRMSMIWGGRASAKTMVLLCMIAQVQRDGGKPAFLDIEGTFDDAFAVTLGVDLDNLYLVSAQDKRLDEKGNKMRPLSGEEWYDIANLLIHSGLYNLVGIDSISAAVPMSLINEKTIDQAKFKGAQAQMNSNMLRLTNSYLIMQPHCHFTMISQSRDVFGQIGNTSSKPSGGNAPGFYISYEIESFVTKTYREKLPVAEGVNLTIEQDVAVDLRLKLTKNKVARIMEPAEIFVDLRTGVCQATDVGNTAHRLGLITQSGSWYKYGEWKWQGIDNMIADLKIYQELYDHMRMRCINTLGVKYTDMTQPVETETEIKAVPEYGTEKFNEKLEEFKTEEPEYIPEGESQGGPKFEVANVS